MKLGKFRKNKSSSKLSRLQWGSVFGLALVISLAFLVVWSVQAASDTGFKDFSYTGVFSPTGQKPQSKLWYNDDSWWGSLFNKLTLSYEIYRFDWEAQTWSTTNTLVDSRTKSSADVLWNGSQLYIASAVHEFATDDPAIRVLRYSYDTEAQTYSLDPGFPVTVASQVVEAVVIDQDSLGKLWITYRYDSIDGITHEVYVSHSTTNDSTWVTPFLLPVAGASTLMADDISSLVAYNEHVGVLWSNQTEDTVYFASHADGDADDVWTLNPALQGPGYADDHLNIKSLQADASGQVFAVVKTSLNDVPGDGGRPLILLLTLDNQGSWSRRTFGTVEDNHTRPILLLDNENRVVYVFATIQYIGQYTGAIYYKSTSLDDPQQDFPSGLGTPFIEFASDQHINDASSTKQTVNSTNDLLVIAGDDSSRFYFHNVIDIGTPHPTPTPPPEEYVQVIPLVWR
jgi:hypothetical protein